MHISRKIFYVCMMSIVLMPVVGLSKKNRRISKEDIVAFNHDYETIGRQIPKESKFAVTQNNLKPSVLSDRPVDLDVKTVGNNSEKNPTTANEPEVVLGAMAVEEVENELEPAQDETEFIEFNFENADLQNFIKQIQDIFDITFLSDDAIDPLIKGARAIKGNKITFKTQKPLSRNQAWELFVTFMQISGLAVVKHNLPRTYRITTIESARKMPIPSFIGTYYTELPDSDEMIRYVYFVENSSLETIKTIVDSLRSSSSSFIILQEQKAFILTERAYNVKKLMEIVKELDKTAMPQTMSLLQLKQADAKAVKELYDSILGVEEKTGPNRFMNPRKQQTNSYLPENIKMIVEPYKNALVLIGQADGIRKVEDFVKKYIDTELSQPYLSFFVYQLKYADVITIADIMNNVTQFGKDTDAGKFGGVRGNDQYMKQLIFVPEKETNRLIIKGKFEDYLRAVEILEQLDASPKQISIEILILGVTIQDTKSLGAQIRSKAGDQSLLGSHIKFQTSGMFQTSKIQENTADTPGVNRLLGNLLQVVQGAASGNTILSLGSDIYNVWGVFQALQKVANTNTVANPFLIATNKTPAVVALGQTRRVATSTVVGNTTESSFGDQKAELRVQITPQINSDGMIILDLDIQYDNFVNATSFDDATKNVRQIKTSTVVADKEVLALGGLIRAQSSDDMNKTPFLGDLPGLGWLFKNKQKEQQKENLLILISTHIIDPHEVETTRDVTQKHIDEYYGTLGQMADAAASKDPINKLFFQDGPNSLVTKAEDALFGRKNSNVVSKRKRNKARRRRDTKKHIEPFVAPASEESMKGQIAKNDTAAADQLAVVSGVSRKKRSQPLQSLFSVSDEKEVA